LAVKHPSTPPSFSICQFNVLKYSIHQPLTTLAEQCPRLQISSGISNQNDYDSFDNRESLRLVLESSRFRTNFSDLHPMAFAEYLLVQPSSVVSRAIFIDLKTPLTHLSAICISPPPPFTPLHPALRLYHACLNNFPSLLLSSHKTTYRLLLFFTCPPQSAFMACIIRYVYTHVIWVSSILIRSQPVLPYALSSIRRSPKVILQSMIQKGPTVMALGKIAAMTCSSPSSTIISGPAF
jgi:hypothetical protein